MELQFRTVEREELYANFPSSADGEVNLTSIVATMDQIYIVHECNYVTKAHKAVKMCSFLVLCCLLV